MRLRSLVKIALQNFLSRKLRALLTVAAVTIGIAAIIFLISLGYGLERLVTSQVVNFDAFTIVDIPSANLKVQKINIETINTFKQISHVKTLAPSINIGGKLKIANGESTVESVVQSSSLEYIKMSGTALKEGEWFGETKDEAVINTVLANLLFKEGTPTSEIIGKSIDANIIIDRDLRLPDAEAGSVVKTLPTLKVTGITEEGESPIAYIGLNATQSAGAINYTTIKLKVDDKQNIEIVRKALENLGYITEYVGDTIKQIADIFSYFRILLGAFGFIALIVASLGTFNTLTISLLERIREIGLLKVIGMQSRDIYRLFLAESLFIGVLGGIIGVIMGYSGGLVINLILRALANKAGVEPVAIFYTPWTLAFYVGIFSILIGFLTGWYPARRAVKTNALDAIRYE